MTTPRIRPDLKATPAEEQGIKFFDVADPRLKLKRGRDRHARAVITPHAIDGYSDQRTYSSLVLETFLPR